MSTIGTLDGKATRMRDALRPVVQLSVEVDSPVGCSVYDLAREMARRFATQETDKVAGLLYLLRINHIPTYDESISPEKAWGHCLSVLPIERKVEILCDFPYRGEERWFPTWAQLLAWPLRDPQYVHVRSVWRDEKPVQHSESGPLDSQASIFVTNIWAVPNVQLGQSAEPNEYQVKIEGHNSSYAFYSPYLDQAPIPSKLTASLRFTLATVSLGHSNNWVVCQVLQPRKLANGEETTVLKKIGVLATDSCSELFIHAGTSRSMLKKISCLFV